MVVLSHVLAHFPRDDALKVLQRGEKIASRLIYIETPFGFLEQVAHDGNTLQRHLSGWYPHDFYARGYSIFGSGHRLLRGPFGKPLFPENLTRTIELSTQRARFRRPYGSHSISAFRLVDEFGNVRSI